MTRFCACASRGFMTVSDRCSQCGGKIPVFTTCNVCGCPLRGDDEFEMGTCSRCASEEIDDNRPTDRSKP